MAKYKLAVDAREVAVPTSAQGLEQPTRLDAEREQDFAIIAEMRAAFKEVPDEELERELSRAFTEARKKHCSGQQRPAAKML